MNALIFFSVVFLVIGVVWWLQRDPTEQRNPINWTTFDILTGMPGHEGVLTSKMVQSVSWAEVETPRIKSVLDPQYVLDGFIPADRLP